jgi:hypothetical protein
MRHRGRSILPTNRNVIPYGDGLDEQHAWHELILRGILCGITHGYSSDMVGPRELVIRTTAT